jgi:hypothetical protein
MHLARNTGTRARPWRLVRRSCSRLGVSVGATRGTRSHVHARIGCAPLTVHDPRSQFIFAALLAAVGCGNSDSGSASTQSSNQSQPSAGNTAASAGTSSASTAGAGAATPACDRACLTQFNTDYLTALTARDASRLPTAENVRFTENGKDLPLNDGLWKVAMSLGTYRQDFSESANGQTGGFVVLNDDLGPVILSFRMKVVARKVSEIETIVARQGQASFFTPEALTMNDPIYDTALEPFERSARMKLIEIVDTYFQGLDSGDGSMIPFAETASREENGTVTASGPSISNLSGFSYIEEITRRYLIVDEERGVVSANILFQIPMTARGMRTLHLSELFKVKAGKLMKITAFMVNQPLGTISGWENDGLSFAGMGITP